MSKSKADHRMRRDLKLALAASIVMNVTLTFYNRGSIGQIFLVILAFWLMALCFVIAALIFIIARISPTRQRPMIGLVLKWISPILRRSTTGVVLAGLVAGSALFSLPFGLAVLRYDINSAKAYCENLRPAIERHRTETGRYPEFPPGILPEASLPRLLRSGGFHRAQVDDYMFFFEDPSGIFDTIVYDSRRGAWRVDHD